MVLLFDIEAAAEIEGPWVFPLGAMVTKKVPIINYYTCNPSGRDIWSTNAANEDTCVDEVPPCRGVEALPRVII